MPSSRPPQRLWFTLSIGAWLGLSLLSLLVFIVAQSLPLVKTSIWGFWGEQCHFLSIIVQSYQQGHYWLSGIALAVGFIVPLLLLCIQTYLLLGLQLKRLVPGFKWLIHLMRWLSPWGMVPVFFLGLLVALLKVADMRTIDLQWGMVAYSCLAILLMAMQGLSAWRIQELAYAEGLLGQKGANLSIAAPQSSGSQYNISQHNTNQSKSSQANVSPNNATQSNTIAASEYLPISRSIQINWSVFIPIFLFAAFVFLIMANLRPMMQISTLLSSNTYTLWAGIANLWLANKHGLAVLIFTFSILVPGIKILVLSLLYWQVRNASLHAKRQVFWYKALKFSAQWSMLDVVVVLVLAVLMNFGFLLSVKPLDGALFFTLMVLATVLASACFRVDRELSPPS